MPDLTAILPITVISAIILFTIKEGLEAWRRRQTDNRKRRGITQLIERECLANLHAADRIEKICRDIKESEDLKEDDEIVGYDCIHKIRITKTGKVLYERTSLDGKLESGCEIPSIAKDALNKHMLDAAGLGGTLFTLMQDTQSILADLEHIRSSLINYLDDEPDFLIMFCGYGISHLPDLRRKLAMCYEAIVGKVPVIKSAFPSDRSSVHQEPN